MPTAAPNRKRDQHAPLPARRFIRQAEVEGYLGRQVAEDAKKSGHLPVICRKESKTRPAQVFYSRVDVIAVEQMILEGRYPSSK